MKITNDNVTQTIRPDSGYNGLSEVMIESDIPTIQNIQSLNIRNNGIYNLTPIPPNDYITKAEINVDVPTEVVELQNKTVNINQNGESIVSADQGYDALGSVTINTNVPTPEHILQNKTVNINQNGEEVISADTGYDALETVTINTNVIAPETRLTTVEHTFSGDTEEPYVITTPSGYDGLSQVSINVDTLNRYSTNYNSLLSALPVPVNLDKTQFYVSSSSDSLQTIPVNTTYDETTFGDIDTETEVTKKVADLVPFKIVNQYNGAIYHENGNYQVAFDNAPSEADSGYTLDDKNLGCPVNRYSFRINVNNKTTPIEITENGTYTPLSPNIGYNSVVVNVPQSSKLDLKYISLRQDGNTPTGVGKLGFDFDQSWDKNNTSSSISINVESGRTLLTYSILNGNYLFNVMKGGSGLSTYVSPNKYYKLLVYDLGSEWYMLDSNLRPVVTTSGSISQNIMVLSSNNFNLVV